MHQLEAQKDSSIVSAIVRSLFTNYTKASEENDKDTMDKCNNALKQYGKNLY